MLESQYWYQIAQKGRFPVSSQQTFLPYLHQKLRKTEKTKNLRIFDEIYVAKCRYNDFLCM